MKTIILSALSGACVAATTAVAAGGSSGALSSESLRAIQLAGIVLNNGDFRARVLDNSSRLSPVSDSVASGYNGLASLICRGPGRNIFNPAGLNYESSHTKPKMGKLQDVWNAPRVAPMTIEQVDAHTVRLTQKGADAAGLNAEIVYHLGANYIDQTITVWPDVDIESSDTFWASYMNFVQNTSLFLHAALQGEHTARWLELTSAGHYGSGNGMFFRPFDPAAKAWYEFLVDNPVRRQAVVETPVSLAATAQAGFKPGQVASFDNYFFGFVDDYVALWIFRPSGNGRFYPWISASGGEALRRPAWDFGISSGPQNAGERRTFHVRLVYKPFVGIDDVLKEVKRFQTPETP